MCLKTEEIESILESNFDLDFVKITLIQQIEDNPKVYCGPGSIFLDKQGKLKLKMYHDYQSNEHMLGDQLDSICGNGLLPGKLFKRQDYYSLEAIDISGRKWQAEDLRLNFGHVIKASITSITHIYEISDKSSLYKGLFIIPGIYKIPFNKYKESDQGFSLTICNLKIGNSECEIEQLENHLEVFISTETSDDFNLLLDLIFEAISIGIDSFLIPLVKTIESGDSQKTSIFSKRYDTNSMKLKAPIPLHPSHHAAFNEFVNQYVTSLNESRSSLFGYWFRNFYESSEVLINIALVLTISIEYILKLKFPKNLSGYHA